MSVPLSALAVAHAAGLTHTGAADVPDDAGSSSSSSSPGGDHRTTLPGSEQVKEALSTRSAYNESAAMLSSFGPLKEIKNHFCAFHVYSDDRTRHVESHRFCAHLTEEVHQCVIYSGGDDKQDPLANRRLIGVEYIITERLFKGLPQEEQKYWHSHKYEVESGLLALVGKAGVPQMIEDTAEEPAMTQLHKTYGKTIHTWQPEIHPELPIGPPQLMMSYTADGQIPDELVNSRDERCGINTQKKRKHRAKFLPLDFVKDSNADQSETTGKAVQFRPQEAEIKSR